MWFKRKKDKEIEEKEEISSRFSSIEDLSSIDVEKLSDEEKEVLEKEKKKRETDKQHLDESEKKVSKQSQKKKKILTIVLFIINILVVAGLLTYQLIQEPFVPISGLGLNPWMLILLFFVFFVMMVLDTLEISYLLKMDTGKWRIWLGFKTTHFCRYYDAITPLSIGGEPAAVAYLRKYDVPASSALSIPIGKSIIFYHIGFLILSVMALIVSAVRQEFGAFASIMSILGFVFSFSLLFVVIFLSISKNFGKKLVIKILKLLQKMKIIKNYEKQYLRVTNYVDEFQSTCRRYMKSFKDFSVNFFLTIGRLILLYSMPFIIYCCFYTDGTADLFFKFFICGILTDLSSSCFPLPGGTGMNEITFSALFSSYFTGGRLFWAVLLWRFMTYYLYIFIGITIQAYDVFYGNRKYKWIKKQKELQLETDNFRQIQIQKFRKERALRRKKEIKNM